MKGVNIVRTVVGKKSTDERRKINKSRRARNLVKNDGCVGVVILTGIVFLSLIIYFIFK